MNPKDLKTRALIIGVPKVPYDPALDLPIVNQDVRLLQNALASSGISPKVIGDLDPFQVTKNSILNAISTFCRDGVKDGDTLLIFFSGHGLHFNGKDYLVPSDAARSVLHPDQTYLPVDFDGFFEKSPASTIILFLDACREGVEWTSEADGTKSPNQRRLTAFSQWSGGKVRVAKGREVAIVFSCQAGEYSRYSEATSGCSHFSRALAEILDATHQAKTFGEIYKATQQRLNEITLEARHPPQTIRISGERGADGGLDARVICKGGISVETDINLWSPPPDDWGFNKDCFIGRQREIGDIRDALDGLLRRFAGESDLSGGRAVQVVWVYGFGGMGKSWLLHHTRLDASQINAKLAVLFIDWELDEWRFPLVREPSLPQDIFEVIATRIAQVCQVPSPNPYSVAKERVKKCAEEHRKLNEQFESAILAAKAGHDVDAKTLHILKNAGAWQDNLVERGREIDLWRCDAERWQDAFEAWICITGRNVNLADEAPTLHPNNVLLEGLVGLFSDAAANRPLVLILDTCEILTLNSPYLDRWLLKLVRRLCLTNVHIVVLIASRSAPDLGLTATGKIGWHAEIPRQRFRELPFAENVKFTVEEIAAALKNLRRPAPEAPELPFLLHRITRGVPLAVRVLLDLHEGDDSDLLQELSALGRLAELENEHEGAREVIGHVAHRFLHHLEKRGDRVQDLRDIIALALLQKLDREVLAKLWHPTPVQSRLQQLAKRHSIQVGGDLHAMVREFLRRHWRCDDRPDEFESVLSSLELVVAGLPEVTQPEGSPDAMKRLLLKLNLLSWRLGDGAMDSLVRGLTLALAYEEQVDGIVELIAELPLTAPGAEQAKRLVKVPFERWRALDSRYSWAKNEFGLGYFQ